MHHVPLNSNGLRLVTKPQWLGNSLPKRRPYGPTSVQRVFEATLRKTRIKMGSSSPLRGLDHVLELIVDIHDLGRGRRSDYATQSCVDSLIISGRRDTCGVDAANGLVVGRRRLLQEVPVHGAAHDNGLVHGLEGLVRGDTRQGFQKDGRRPIDALQEWV